MEQDMKKDPIAEGVTQALDAQAEAPAVIRAPIDQQIAQDFNLVSQYVTDCLAKEGPAVQMVMNQVLSDARGRIIKALGG